jgi:hypothetical protein
LYQVVRSGSVALRSTGRSSPSESRSTRHAAALPPVFFCNILAGTSHQQCPARPSDAARCRAPLQRDTCASQPPTTPRASAACASSELRAQAPPPPSTASRFALLCPTSY